MSQKSLKFRPTVQLLEARRLLAGDMGGEMLEAARLEPVAGEVAATAILEAPAVFGFTGGVRVSAGDINNDGIDEIIVSPGPGGGPHVKVFDGSAGGINVAAGDVNGDGIPDIIVGAGPGAGPHFEFFNSQFTGGVFVAAGDINNDGTDDIVISPDVGGGPHADLFVGFTGGVHIAAGDINNDGFADIIVSPDIGGGSHVKVFNAGEPTNFHVNVFGKDFLGGVRVGGGDINNGSDEIITSPGFGGGPHVKVFDLNSVPNNAAADAFFAGLDRETRE